MLKNNNGIAAGTGNAKCIRLSASAVARRRWFLSNPAVKSRFIAVIVFKPNVHNVKNITPSEVSDGFFLLLPAGNPFSGRELIDLDSSLRMKLATGY
jgi:hypothetical protein